MNAVNTQRTAINPVQWSTALGFQQGILLQGALRTLFISGQTAMTPEGAPAHEADMAAQLALSLDNLEGVLAAAGLGLEHLVKTTVFTTDVELLLHHYGVLAERFGPAGVVAATTMVQVSRLAVPGQLVEIGAVAAG